MKVLILLFIGLPNSFAKGHIGCDLRSKRALPKVILVGEVHSDNNSISIRENLMQKGAEGSFPVASEVSDLITMSSNSFSPHLRKSVTRQFNRKQKDFGKLHGIDSPILYAILHSYKIQSDRQFKKDSLDRIAISAETIVLSEDLPMFSTTLRNMTRKAKLHKYSPELNKFITSAQKKVLSDTGLNKNDSFMMSFNVMKGITPLATDEILDEFLTEHHRELISIANKNYLSHFEGKPLPTTENIVDHTLFGTKKTLGAHRGRYRDLIVGKREKEFSYNIAKLLCHYAGKEQQLVVIVGEGHLRGLDMQLKNYTGNNASIQHFKSADPQQGKKLLKQISKNQRLKIDSQPPATENGSNSAR